MSTVSVSTIGVEMPLAPSPNGCSQQDRHAAARASNSAAIQTEVCEARIQTNRSQQNDGFCLGGATARSNTARLKTAAAIA